MRRVVFALASAAALAGGAGPVAAQAALTPDQADARCVMVLQFIARDPSQKEQAAKGILFYTGRISARGPVSRIEAVIRGEANKLSSQQAAQAELTRCAAELNSRSRELQAVNQHLAASATPPARK